MNELMDNRIGHSEGYCKTCHQPLGIEGVCYICAAAKHEIDGTPLCWCCGEPMAIIDEKPVMSGDDVTGYNPIYRCVNPDCEDDE